MGDGAVPSVGCRKHRHARAGVPVYFLSLDGLRNRVGVIANPRHFVVGVAVDADRWRAVTAAMDGRFMLEGLSVLEDGVCVHIEQIRRQVSGSCGQFRAELDPPTPELFDLLGQMVIGDKPKGVRRGSRGEEFLTRIGCPVTRPCPTPDWELWASEQMRQWSATEPLAVVKVLEGLAHPREFADEHQRVNAAVRREAIDRWNGLLAPQGWAIEAIDQDVRATRVRPMFLSIADKVPSPGIGSAGVPLIQRCPGESAVLERVAQRWQEYERCVRGEAYVAAVILLSSVVEAVLLCAVESHPSKANKATAAPKKADKVLPFKDWSLESLTGC